jgi:hypothetical protein
MTQETLSYDAPGCVPRFTGKEWESGSGLATSGPATTLPDGKIHDAGPTAQEEASQRSSNLGIGCPTPSIIL